jgi:hypothetical protein
LYLWLRNHCFTPHDAVLITVENCGPFGCKKETTIDQEATATLRTQNPLGKFVGTAIFTDRGHLAFSEIGYAWQNADSMGAFFSKIYNLPFYRAMAFTLTFTFISVPIC